MAARKYKKPLTAGSCQQCGENFLGQKNKTFCSKACYLKAYASEHRDVVRAHGKAYQHSAKGKAKRAVWEQENEDHLKETRQQDYQKNRSARIAKAAKFAAENPEKVHGYKVKFSKTDAGREHAHLSRQRRLAREKQAHDDGTVTRKSWRAMVLHYRHHCLRCGLKYKFRQLSMDHVLPVSKGGAHTIKNLQPLCLSCNASKGNKIAWDYRGLFDCDYGEFVGEAR